MKFLFTICGRAGSKGVKNKNLKMFCKTPLVYYTIAAIQLYTERYLSKVSDSFDIVLNTDSQGLIGLIKRQTKIHIFVINRSKELSGDTTPKVSVIKDCLLRMQSCNHCIYDLVVDLDITSPLRTIIDIKNAVDKKLSRPDADVVYSVTKSRRNPYFNMVKQKGNFFVNVLPSTYTARQQAPVFYDLNASIYVYSPLALMNKNPVSFFNDRGYAVLMADTGVLDIDSEKDFELMEVIADYLFKKYNAFGEVAAKAAELA